MKIVGGPASRKKQTYRIPKLDVLEVSLAETQLALRTQNTLELHGILTVKHLTTKTVEELLAIPNLGQITIQTLRAFLNSLNVSHRLNESNEVQVQTARKRLDAQKRKTAQSQPKKS